MPIDIPTRYAAALQQLDRGDDVAAAREFERLLPLLVEADDDLGRARVLAHLAAIDETHERLDGAERHYRQALSLLASADDPSLTASVTHRLGHLVRMRRPPEARALFERSRRACEAIGDRRGEAVSLAMIGQIDVTTGAVESGIRTMLQGLSAMPSDASEDGHLVEHLAYFSSRLDSARFDALVAEEIHSELTRQRLHEEIRERRRREARGATDEPPS